MICHACRQSGPCPACGAAAGPTWDYLWPLWAGVKGETLRSFGGDRGRWFGHLQPYFGAMPVPGTTSDDLEYYWELRSTQITRLDDEPAGNSLTIEGRILTRVANWARGEGLIAYHLLHEIDWPDGRRCNVTLSEPQVGLLLRAVERDERLNTWSLMHLDQGLDRTEALTISLDNFLLDARRMVFPRRRGCGSMPLSDRLLKSIAEAKTARRMGTVIGVSPRHVDRLLKPLLERVGLLEVEGEAVGSQMLVRTFRRRLRENLQAPVEIVAALTGRCGLDLAHGLPTPSQADIDFWAQRYHSVYALGGERG